MDFAKDLLNGAMVRLFPASKTVYVKDGFNRTTKRYYFVDLYDINNIKNIPGTKIVYPV